MKCEKLEVWHLAKELSVNVYKTFADCKDYGFKDQITRSGLSIPSNIAEGMEKNSVRDQVRFLDIAKGSAAEFATQTYIAHEVGYIQEETAQCWLVQSEKLLAMLTKLQQYLMGKS